MGYLDELLVELNKLGIIYEGCGPKEIDLIKELISGSLPKCYQEFLEKMGKSMDRKEYGYRGFLVGNSVFYEDIPNNRPGLEELLEEDSSDLQIPEGAFVFYGSQGILYAFFKTNEGDNPPVYGYAEGFTGDDFPKIATSLSSFYERYLESDKELFKEVY